MVTDLACCGACLVWLIDVTVWFKTVLFLFPAAFFRAFFLVLFGFLRACLAVLCLTTFSCNASISKTEREKRKKLLFFIFFSSFLFCLRDQIKNWVALISKFVRNMFFLFYSNYFWAVRWKYLNCYWKKRSTNSW